MLQHAPEGAEGLQEAPGRSELEDVHSDRPLTGHLRLQAREAAAPPLSGVVAAGRPVVG